MHQIACYKSSEVSHFGVRWRLHVLKIGRNKYELLLDDAAFPTYIAPDGSWVYVPKRFGPFTHSAMQRKRDDLRRLYCSSASRVLGAR